MEHLAFEVIDESVERAWAGIKRRVAFDVASQISDQVLDHLRDALFYPAKSQVEADLGDEA